MGQMFIQKIRIKKGALSRQLGIPMEKNIPITLLRKIVRSSPGRTIRNPTKSGKKNIKVTVLIERRAILAINLKNFRKTRRN